MVDGYNNNVTNRVPQNYSQDGNPLGEKGYVSPICIPWNDALFGFNLEPEPVTLAGWGFTMKGQNFQAGWHSKCFISISTQHFPNIVKEHEANYRPKYLILWQLLSCSMEKKSWNDMQLIVTKTYEPTGNMMNYTGRQDGSCCRQSAGLGIS